MSFSFAQFSQADVAGAESACTFVAVLACAAFLVGKSITPEALEMWIYQARDLYRTRRNRRDIYALPGEVIDQVSPALPIVAGREEGMLLQDLWLPFEEEAVVLTCGAYSVAVLDGGRVLVDSHPHPDRAIVVRFDEPQHLVQYLKQYRGGGRGECSWMVVERRLFPLDPRVFPLQEEAFAVADTLPRGFLHVFARDTHRGGGSKEYLASGLDEFLQYYERCDENERHFYDMARLGWPVSLYVDVEFERNLNPNKDGPAMVTELCRLMSRGEDFRVYDASNDVKFSQHIHCHNLWFPNVQGCLEFLMRALGKNDMLRVTREKNNQRVSEWIADLTVYTSNRCFRLPFSSKRDSPRPLLPLENDGSTTFQEHVQRALISPPDRRLFTLASSVVATSPSSSSSVTLLSSSSSSSSSALVPLNVHPSIERLGQFVASVFHPQEMRGCRLDPSGLVTFSMVKHDCTICNDTHNNQVYAVADLKRRVVYPKCHADRSMSGPPEPFPDSLGPLSLLQQPSIMTTCELQPGDARLVLGFAAAVFKNRTILLSSVPVRFDDANRRYEATFPARLCCCGPVTLQVTQSKLVMRCSSRQCSATGRRWERPSSRSSVLWNLSFLFPEATSDITIPDFTSEVVTIIGSEDRFLSTNNFYLALLPDGDDAVLPLPTRLNRLSEWLKESGRSEEALHKGRIVLKILGKEMMEACYRECVAVASDFIYPLQLLPQGPLTLAMALFMHLARKFSFKRVAGDMFYVPFNGQQGRVCYRTLPADELLTQIFTFDKTPNLFAHVVIKSRVGDDLRRLVRDDNHFPVVTVSKRYLGFSDVIYDLQENVTLSWETEGVIPYNMLNRPFADGDALARIKAGALLERTPLFDGALRDQGFTDDVIVWLYALLGRLFHYVGKQDGDNWEIAPFLIGASGTFKSSIVQIVQSFFQPNQVGVIATDVEPRFPLDGIPGKMIAVMTECSGCKLDRDLLKLIVSGDPVRVGGKHKTAIDVPNWIIPMFFAGNGFLDMRDRDGAIERRCAVFPFTRMLRPGQGAVDLAERIIRDEGPLLLIKWNTAYLSKRSNLAGQRIQSVLPDLIKDATREILMRNDSFKSFMFKAVVIQEGAQIAWGGLLQAYEMWCRIGRLPVQPVNHESVDVQVMLARFGGATINNNLVVTGLRLRLPNDPPYMSVFQISLMGAQ